MEDNNKIKEDEELISQKGLLNLLVEKFGTKKTTSFKELGTQFTYQDLFNYLDRGNIPIQYGGNKVTKENHYGVELIRVEGLKELKKSTARKNGR